MRQFLAVFHTEGLKILNSKMVWITSAAFTIGPLMAAFFMFILKNPDFAETSGLLGAKAQLAGEATWPSYFSLLAQIISIGGVIVFGFITSWVFGREYSDQTVKDLLALPFSRGMIVYAKFTAILITTLCLTIYILSIGLLLGGVIGLPGWSASVLEHGLFIFFISALLTMALSTPVAFFACYGKGYLAPLGFIILMVVLAQIIGAIGYGDYFPWAIPALFSGTTGEESPLTLLSLTIILFTSIIGLTGTSSWWKFADHH